MSDEMRGLLRRVEHATGPDRAIDAAIHDATGQPFVMEYWSESDTKPQRNLSYVPAYTSSIDAAVALVEKVLPSAEWLKKDAKAATVYLPPADDKAWAVHHDGLGANFALSLIAGLLRALLAQAGQEV